jgi:hypothetical protein
MRLPVQQIHMPVDSEQGGIDFLSLLGPGTILAILIVVLVLLLAALVTAWVIVRRVRRSGALKRIQHGVEKTVQGGLLKVRAETGEGVARELARQRLRLRACLDSTAFSLELARADQRPVGEFSAIMDTLNEVGSVLDGQLRVAEREPDDASRQAMSTALDGQLEMIERTGREIRGTLAQAGLSLGNGELKDVAARLAVESQVLKTWIQSYTASGRSTDNGFGDDQQPKPDGPGPGRT